VTEAVVGVGLTACKGERAPRRDRRQRQKDKDF